MSGGVEVVSFGCRLNGLEAATMKRAAVEAGLGRDRPAVLVNSCAVTAEAVRDAKRAVRRARAANPEALILVSGCAAQVHPEDFAAMPEADGVVGNHEKRFPGTYARDFGLSEGEKIRVDDVFSIRETAPHLAEVVDGRTRAVVEVQNGCDHRCTFCIIPFGRGPSRSVPMGAVVDGIRRLVDEGCAEVVLSGVDLTSYGADLPGTPRLGTLVQAILAHVPGLRRLRLSSIDSVEADEALVDAMATEARLMPHLHLSLQSGDDLILKRMKRRHRRADAVRFCEDLRAKRPDISFGADLIAGFPTETEAMAENTRALIADCGIAFLHVFPFSARPGTPASRMPPVAPPLITARAKRLREAGAAALRRHLDAKVGSLAAVLVERNRTGRLPDFTPVAIMSDEPGRIVEARIVAVEGGRRLIAEKASDHG
ncbi:tRNA (N(6)-L-threonylcarbamoyladenosine(37)-C(2))-methylthiotransferase MtaB [Aureimonas leprariae]|uniref:tRNA (N(6)-L-threonylcarbamoyladenosine(37)-C(2))-methylthiotransferase MtaB n=1 Tax=Plantimonas leprariae TaxID=2615207 RepID=A0A7V7TX73_9HYPH|nr:tRNA (N(6)-L-threonylcarbamoyladenosine(37)-C(2))-methylthiotransferase MtaB [Aureimonas leprariae]KAB0681204.1 tRNA (N(6)-L-threonylcarbamoyladenosine(37)-C(2))-methylthiotransferase MtaB [Aureimonas leprariae]